MSKRTIFPTVPLHEVPSSGSIANDHTQAAHRPVVMVVDDESSIADTLAEILSRSGYAAMTAYDGDSALEAVLLSPPELLISDVVLPGMSGIDLAISVKRIFPDCKIILFSGQASTADLLAAAGRDGHHFVLLNKPIHPGELLARIAGTLKPHRQQPAAV